MGFDWDQWDDVCYCGKPDFIQFHNPLLRMASGIGFTTLYNVSYDDL
jgi:hypothetical protein